MATQKITITLDAQQLRQVQGMVAAGMAPNVSAFIKHAVGIALLDASGWSAMLSEALEETGGPLTSDERRWADGVLKVRAGSKRRRRAA